MRAVAHNIHENDYTNIQEKLEAEIAALRHKLVVQETTINYLSRQAQEDMLTGLLNRRGFEKRLQDALAAHKRYGHNACLMMIDVDNFKHINDTYGHLAGDAVLRHIANFLRTELREGDTICRLAGDEFSLILKEISGEDAHKKAESLMQKIKQKPCVWAQQNINVGISVGACSFTESTHEKELFELADKRMYRAKSVK